MTDWDLMSEAIRLAKLCTPSHESIPKVGAVIAWGGTILGSGSRGSKQGGDDEHAERRALGQVADKAKLPQASLYTTLEPCTREVRTKPLECCTELILQYKIKKVFIGILDPNQGVAGKGLSNLQENGVEVELFPHELAQEIRAINTNFIRSQQTLGATIMSPANGETLETYKTTGRHPVRFRCLNPPNSKNHLLTCRNGLYWPQPNQFRRVSEKVWEIDSHFGSVGEHTLELITATDFGQVLIDYYWSVVRSNVERKEKLKNAVNDQCIEFLGGPKLKLLGGDYTGIPMVGLGKGFRSEASVNVVIVGDPRRK